MEAPKEPISRVVTHDFRVRYAETDAMGIVHHSSYVAWMEMGRTEFMRAHGFPYRELEEMGVLLPVLELWIRYKQPAHYDDELRISCWADELTRTRILLHYSISRISDERFLCEGTTLHTYMGRDGRPVRITHYPEAWARLQAMVRETTTGDRQSTTE